MAVKPSDLYPGQISTTDPDYPQGKAVNIVSPGDGTGTPLEKTWLNDQWGFQQDLLDRGGITPSGTPDKVGASQYVQGIEAVAADVQAPIEAVVRTDLLTSRGTFAHAHQARPQFDPTPGRPTWELGDTTAGAFDVMTSYSPGGVLSWGFSAGANLPFSVTVTGVRCWVKQAVAYIVGNRMKMRVSSRDSGTFASTIIDTVDAGPGTGVQKIEKTGLSVALVATDTAVFPPSGPELDLTVALFAGLGEPVPVGDIAYFCEVRYTLAVL